jgi:hypothetical protein
MLQKVLKINPSDNVIVALVDLKKDETVVYNNISYQLKNDKIQIMTNNKINNNKMIRMNRITKLNLRTDDDNNEDDDDFEGTFEERINKKYNKRFPSKSKSNRSNDKNSNSNSNIPFLYGLNRWEVLNRAVVAGVFVAGIGSGIAIDSAINTNPKDLASRDAIDRNAPNPKLCAQYGSSAMVLDQRVFITFNPFNVYVTQADTKPGCVLRAANVVPLLQQEKQLITNEEVEYCKNSYNTWAFVGDINNKPQLNCVFQSDDAQNEFLSNPKVGLGEDYLDDDNDK